MQTSAAADSRGRTRQLAARVWTRMLLRVCVTWRWKEGSHLAARHSRTASYRPYCV